MRNQGEEREWVVERKYMGERKKERDGGKRKCYLYLPDQFRLS